MISRAFSFVKKMITLAFSFRVTSISEELFIEGKSFSGRDYFSIPSDDHIYMIFDGRKCNCNQIIFEPLRFVGIKGGPIYIDIYNYNDTIGTLGAPLRVGNRREGQAGPEAKFNFIAAGEIETGALTSSTKLNGRIIPSSSALGQTSNSGDSAGVLPFEVIKENVKIIDCYNADASNAVEVEYNFTFFEN